MSSARTHAIDLATGHPATGIVPVTRTPPSEPAFHPQHTIGTDVNPNPRPGIDSAADRTLRSSIPSDPSLTPRSGVGFASDRTLRPRTLFDPSLSP